MYNKNLTVTVGSVSCGKLNVHPHRSDYVNTRGVTAAQCADLNVGWCDPTRDSMTRFSSSGRPTWATIFRPVRNEAVHPVPLPESPATAAEAFGRAVLPKKPVQQLFFPGMVDSISFGSCHGGCGSLAACATAGEMETGSRRGQALRARRARVPIATTRTSTKGGSCTARLRHWCRRPFNGTGELAASSLPSACPGVPPQPQRSLGEPGLAFGRPSRGARPARRAAAEEGPGRRLPSLLQTKGGRRAFPPTGEKRAAGHVDGRWPPCRSGQPSSSTRKEPRHARSRGHRTCVKARARRRCLRGALHASAPCCC